MLLNNGGGKITIKNTTIAGNIANNHETSGAIAFSFAFGNAGGFLPASVTLTDTIFENNCSKKDIVGTNNVENCDHFTHALTAQNQGNNKFVGKPVNGSGSIYEWPVNKHAALDEAFPIATSVKNEEVGVKVLTVPRAIPPVHPCSSVAVGSGGKCM